MTPELKSWLSNLFASYAWDDPADQLKAADVAWRLKTTSGVTTDMLVDALAANGRGWSAADIDGFFAAHGYTP